MVGKIEKLSPEQEALLPMIRDKWLDLVNNPPPLNLTLARETIKDLYAFIQRREPHIEFVSSPKDCQEMANRLCRTSGVFYPPRTTLLHCAGKLAEIDFFLTIEEFKEGKRYTDLLMKEINAGIYYAIYFEEFAFVCGPPEKR